VPRLLRCSILWRGYPVPFSTDVLVVFTVVFVVFSSLVWLTATGAAASCGSWPRSFQFPAAFHLELYGLRTWHSVVNSLRLTPLQETRTSVSRYRLAIFQGVTAGLSAWPVTCPAQQNMCSTQRCQHRPVRIMVQMKAQFLQSVTWFVPPVSLSWWVASRLVHIRTRTHFPGSCFRNSNSKFKKKVCRF
jgi:hypothetical protein